jgi:hypothetical protein
MAAELASVLAWLDLALAPGMHDEFLPERYVIQTRRTAWAAHRVTALNQNRWMMPTPAANWLGDDDGADWKPSPTVAVALMMLLAPAVPSVFPFAR